MSLILNSNDGRILPHISNLYHFNRVPHLNTLQGTCSPNKATFQVFPAQPSGMTSCAGWDSTSLWRYFQTCKKTQTFVRMNIFAYYNLRGLTLRYAQLLTSIGDHLSPIQTTDPVCPTTHLSNAYLWLLCPQVPSDWKCTLYWRQWTS
jgi:hypothetical protein